MTTNTNWLQAWKSGNETGNGYAVGEETDSPAAAVAREGWEIVERHEEGSVVARRPDGRRVAVCNANGPWAVDLPQAVAP